MTLLIKSLFVLGVVATTAEAQTQLAIRTSEAAWVHIDGQRRGMTTPATPLKLAVTPGQHKVGAEALVGTGRQELEVDAEANATTYVQIKLGNGVWPPYNSQNPTAQGSVSPYQTGSQATPSLQDDYRQRQLEVERQQKERQRELDRQQRESKIRQLEMEVTGLERQLAAAESMKDSAEQARQNCKDTQQGPAFLGALKATNCVLGELNYSKAQQEVRRLQVEIASKQRELQRLDRQNGVY